MTICKEHKIASSVCSCNFNFQAFVNFKTQQFQWHSKLVNKLISSFDLATGFQDNTNVSNYTVGWIRGTLYMFLKCLAYAKLDGPLREKEQSNSNHIPLADGNDDS